MCPRNSVMMLVWLGVALVGACAVHAADMVYQLDIPQAAGPRTLCPARVMLRVTNGRITHGFALAPHLLGEPGTLDWTRVTVSPNGVNGTLVIDWPQRSKDASVQTLRGEYQVDVAFKADVGSGSMAGTTGSGRGAAAVRSDRVSARRWPLEPVPSSAQLDFGLPLGDLPNQTRESPQCFLRFTLMGGEARQGQWFINPQEGGQMARALPIERMQLSVAEGGGIAGGFTVQVKDKPLKVRLTATVIGDGAAGEATFDYNGKTWSCGTIGRVNRAQRQAPEAPLAAATWSYALTRKPDAEMAKEAAERACRPLGVQDPKDGLYWTWRLLMRRNSIAMHAIHPPAFDLVGPEEATTYRFDIEGPTKHSFSDTKPNVSLAAVWREMKPGEYRVKVVPLDAAGKEIAQAVRMRHLTEDGLRGPNPKIELAALPGPIIVTKRPSFQGPYCDPPRDTRTAVLAAARWFRELPHMGEFNGLAPYPGIHDVSGDNKTNYRVHDPSYCNLLVRQLSTDPLEQQRALADALHAGAAGVINSHVTGTGLLATYKFNTNTHNVGGDAFLNLYEATGEERWQEAALRFARGLARLQKPNGTFEWSYADKVHPLPVTNFDRRVWIESNPSEVLCFFGRLRHVLRTNEFKPIEKKAHAFLKEWTRKEFTWLEVGPHSHVWHYPQAIHSRSPQHWCLYQLLYADAEDRDLALVEELALWSEDRNIEWGRPASPGGRIYPHGFGSVDGYRSSGPPISFVSRLALIYLKLHAYTKKPLHLEKARALHNSVLWSQNPATGEFSLEQSCSTGAGNYPDFKHQLTAYTLRYLLEYQSLADRSSGDTLLNCLDFPAEGGSIRAWQGWREWWCRGIPIT